MYRKENNEEEINANMTKIKQVRMRDKKRSREKYNMKKSIKKNRSRHR